DVLYLQRAQAEVDRHQHSAVARDSEKRHEEARRVLRHDGDALALPYSERIEARRLRPSELPESLVRNSSERLRRLAGFIDDPDACAVHALCASQEISNRQLYDHGLLRLDRVYTLNRGPCLPSRGVDE